MPSQKEMEELNKQRVKLQKQFFDDYLKANGRASGVKTKTLEVKDVAKEK